MASPVLPDPGPGLQTQPLELHGRLMTGPMMADLLEQVVAAVNAGGVPSVARAAQYILRVSRAGWSVHCVAVWCVSKQEI